LPDESTAASVLSSRFVVNDCPLLIVTNDQPSPFSLPDEPTAKPKKEVYQNLERNKQSHVMILSVVQYLRLIIPYAIMA
jgi:hypothetical protein